jgi:hypothetical protein
MSVLLDVMESSTGLSINQQLNAVNAYLELNLSWIVKSNRTN